MRSMYLKILTLTFVALLCSACKTPAPWYKFGSNATNNGFAPSPTATGTLAWSFNTGLSVQSGAVLDAVNSAYITSTNATAFALTPEGKVKWQFTAGQAIHTTPAVENGNVYFGADDGFVYALNSKTGTLLWKFNTQASILASISPAGTTLYAANTQGEVFCLNSVTGKEIWEFFALGEIDSTPAQAPGGALYFGTTAGWLYALNAGSGKILWRGETAGAITAAPVVGARDHVYVGSNDGIFHAFDAIGVELWEFHSGAVGRRTTWAPAAVIYIGGVNNQEIVYVANGQTIAALDSTNATVLWRDPPWFSQGYVSQPAVAPNGTLLIGNTSEIGGSLLAAADRLTGKLQWSASFGSILNTPAVGVDGRVYITSWDGNLYVEK